MTNKEEQGKAQNTAGVRQVCSWGWRPGLKAKPIADFSPSSELFCFKWLKSGDLKGKIRSFFFLLSVNFQWASPSPLVELGAQSTRTEAISPIALNPSSHSQPHDKESQGTKQRQGSKNQQCATLSEITSFCYYLFIDCYGLEGHFNQQVFSSTPPAQGYLHNVGRVLAAVFLPTGFISEVLCIVSHLYFLPALLDNTEWTRKEKHSPFKKWNKIRTLG